MLDVGDRVDAFDAVWSRLDLRVALTRQLRADHAKQGPLPGAFEERRRQARFYFWRRAVLAHGEERYAAFTVNRSKSGLCLVSPRQLFPNARVQLVLETGQTFDVAVRRCRRLGEDCYECGGEFLVLPGAS